MKTIKRKSLLHYLLGLLAILFLCFFFFLTGVFISKSFTLRPKVDTFIESRFARKLVFPFRPYANVMRGLLKNKIYLHVNFVKGFVSKKFNDQYIIVDKNSRTKAQSLIMADGNIGIASKDLSVMKSENIETDNVKLGLRVFVKKSEFGQGTILLKKIKFINGEKNIEKKDDLTIVAELEA